MSFSVTASTRKARRKEERERKKQHKRAKHSKKNDTTTTEVKRKTAPSKPERSPGKKARRSPSIADPYENLPEEDEPTHCSICLTYRQGPCRPYWRKVEACTKDNELKKGSDEDKEEKEDQIMTLRNLQTAKAEPASNCRNSSSL